MKKLLPFLLLFALLLPQLSIIGKWILVSKSDRNAIILLMTSAEEEEDGSETEKESESKKFLNSFLIFESVLLFEHLEDDHFFDYINHYDFFYSNITLPPPRIS